MHPGTGETDPHEPRGSGAGSAPAPTKLDCKLIELALRERWDISETTRAAMLRELASVIEDAGIITRKPRLFLAVARTLAALSRGNLAGVDTAIRARQSEELDERVKAIEERLKQGGGS